MLRSPPPPPRSPSSRPQPRRASPCKDAKGKFVKCPPSHIVKGKDGKCRFIAGPNKGKFAKCG